ncbi:unnamed protein product [Closterium sp. Yama58-4]|nr:unnamed protein product [Closterium sp. Yama58-4]
MGDLAPDECDSGGGRGVSAGRAAGRGRRARGRGAGRGAGRRGAEREMDDARVMAGWGDGGMGRWRDGVMAGWGDGWMGRWRDGAMARMGRWRDGAMAGWRRDWCGLTNQPWNILCLLTFLSFPSLGPCDSVAAWACARLGELKRALMRRAMLAVHCEFLLWSASPSSSCSSPSPPTPPHCSVAAWACARLGEPKRGLMRRAVHALGGDAVRGMVAEVDAVQRCGGQLTADGKRRRTPGGVFWNILRARVSADVYNEIMAEERELQKRRERGQASKKRKRHWQHKGGEAVGGSICGATAACGGADREGMEAMSLSLEGCTRDDDRPHAADDAAAAADVAQGRGARWQASSGVCVRGDDRQHMEHGVTVGKGGMVEDSRVEVRGVGEQVQCGEGRAAGLVGGREEEGVAEGDIEKRDGDGRGDGEEVVAGVVEGGVLHAWRCAVMPGKGAGEGWEEGEEGEWHEGDCDTVGRGVLTGEAGLKVGVVDNVVANGVGDVAANGLGDVANGVGDVAANGVGDVAAIGVGDVAANGVGAIHERESEEDPMEVDGECGEAVCMPVPPCVGEQRESDQHEVDQRGAGAEARAGVSVRAKGGTAEIAALSCRGVERGGTPGAAAALPGVRKAQGGEQRVSVKQRLRVPVKYDDMPGTVEEVVEGSAV